MRRNFEVFDFAEIGVRGAIKAIGKKVPDIIAAKIARRQADRMNDDKLDRRAFRPLVAIGGGNVDGALQQPLGINIHAVLNVLELDRPLYPQFSFGLDETLPGAARRLVTFSCAAKRKSPKRRPPRCAGSSLRKQLPFL